MYKNMSVRIYLLTCVYVLVCESLPVCLYVCLWECVCVYLFVVVWEWECIWVHVVVWEYICVFVLVSESLCVSICVSNYGCVYVGVWECACVYVLVCVTPAYVYMWHNEAFQHTETKNQSTKSNGLFLVCPLLITTDINNLFSIPVAWHAINICWLTSHGVIHKIPVDSIYISEFLTAASLYSPVIWNTGIKMEKHQYFARYLSTQWYMYNLAAKASQNFIALGR